MARGVPRDGASTGEVIAQEALELFYTKGYHATSIRDIATAASVATSTLFHHYTSKEDILARIMLHSLDVTYARVQQADAAAEDPVGRMRQVVTTLVQTHTELQHESFVNNAELRSLSPALAQEVIAARRRLGDLVTAIVRDGVATGDFHVERAEEAATAIITMVSAVATWFRASGPRTPEQIGESYVVFALRLLGADHPEGGRPQPAAEEPTGSRTGSTSKSSRFALRVRSQ